MVMENGILESNKKKVVIVYHFFAHYRQAVIHELINCSEYNYFFAGERKDPFRANIKPSDVAASPRYIYTRCFVPFPEILIQTGLIRLALRKDVAVIIFLGDSKFLSTWISAIFARISGKRVLFWTHGWLRYESGLKSFIRCSFYRLGNGMLLYGKRAKQFGLAKGFKSRNMYIVYNSLDTRNQEEIRSRITTKDICEIREKIFGHWNRPVIICTGRLIPKLQLDLLLEAVSLIQKEGRIIDVLLVGDGIEQDRLKAMAKSKDLSVFFYGACYEEEMLARLIMSANVMVVPGAIGLTVIHSLIYGTPVITHDDPDEQGPEWEAIISGKNGQLFKKGDTKDLAATIKNWINSDLPDEIIRKQCYNSIDKCYNPSYQVQVINASVEGRPADEINCPYS
jgi:glycosyltransferase involved in cell wall biosynthesis